jgi:WD40-like Beta Propeller Repeat
VVAALLWAAQASAAINGRIAFVSDRDGDNEIYTMNPDGSGVLPLTNNTANDRFPEFSPDGTRIAFNSDRSGANQVYAMNADGSGQAPLTSDGGSKTDPTWSPDGTQIAFVKTVALQTVTVDIFSMSSAGGPQVNLTNGAGMNVDPSWAPDGTRIAFASDRAPSAGFDIWTMAPNGATPTLLPVGTTKPERFPDWSPDGGRIAFQRSSELLIANANGSGLTPLAGGTVSGGNPVWSPDGTQIAFASDQDGNQDIYRVSIAGAPGLTRLTLDPAADGFPDWAPGSNGGDPGGGGDGGDGSGGVTTVDRDGDGVDNVSDNCPDAVNPSQVDMDADQIGDLCDDSNGDLTPVAGETVVARVVSGRVFIRYPTGKRPTPFTGAIEAARMTQVQKGAQPGFVPLKGAATVPIGSTIDTEEGRIALTSAADRRRHTQTADFYDGVFKLLQESAARPVTELRLQSLPYRANCGTRSAAARTASSRRHLGRLWGSGKGRFRTRGRFSAASVRGTKWLTVDRCDGTLTQVKTGRVSVFERATGRRIILRANRAYLAKATAKARRKAGLF